jgi:hypothetical protein
MVGCGTTTSVLDPNPLKIRLPKISYNEPYSGNIALIRTSAENELIVFFATFLKPEKCQHRKVIFNQKEGTSAFKKIQAAKEFTFYVWVSKRTLGEYRKGICEISGIFTPVADKEYEFLVEHKEEKCQITFNELDKSHTPVSVVTYRKIKTKHSFFVTSESGKWCS